MKKSCLLLLSIFFILNANHCFSQERKITPRAWYHYYGPLPIDEEIRETEPGKLYFQFDLRKKPATIDQGTLYRVKNDSLEFFTAYLINQTDTIVQMIHQDGSLMMIQEALDSNGNWRPIEVWYHSDCGNSYMGSPDLEPRKYFTFYVPKYKGSFKTKLRLKLKIGKSIFYSSTFDGSLDPGQFNQMDVSAKYDFKSYLDE